MTVDRVVISLLKPGKQREVAGARSFGAKNAKPNFVIANFEVDDDFTEPATRAA
jgi:hypothetical protein